ncbi:GTP 3',8-cyclase MoaA [Stratiformator vulcanicus]|uniref:GTP 3',8-cyclase n=1 Tax=Stratiformator vulcanicus TaxID=2527980 RepID=A0A517QWC5_9PLAN|nr:GTP 3',8-cyclase MoaA [Stratiformator vulcanicus]QDT35870.1 Cyclic pyranopterin monophosphate synthase [Stratiformator vulcanicus]
MLIDRYGRRHTSLRVSVTDRCNLRCTYCMPEATPDYHPRSEILTFEEISRVAQVAASLGVTKVRLTGGEPLVRSELHTLVRMLDNIENLKSIALTTNGTLLAEQAPRLYDAGLRSINVSLDALNEADFQAATRRPGLTKVLAGIDAARDLGMVVKLNAIAMRGVTESQLESFGLFARETGITVRFIEFMPLEADQFWSEQQVLGADEIITRLGEAIRPLVLLNEDSSSPATQYEFNDGVGRIGIISSVTKPFCGSCDRFRLTADGKVRSCLFGDDSGDVRKLLRNSADDQAIAELLREVISNKKAGHGTDDLTFLRPHRAMHSIGG